MILLFSESRFLKYKKNNDYYIIFEFILKINDFFIFGIRFKLEKNALINLD